MAFLLPFGEGRVRQTFLRFGKIVCRTRGSEEPLPAPVGASVICSARRAGVSLLCRPRPAYPPLTIGQHRRITSPTLGLCGDGSLMTQLLPGGASLVTGMAYAVLRPNPDSAAAMWGAHPVCLVLVSRHPCPWPRGGDTISRRSQSPAALPSLLPRPVCGLLLRPFPSPICTARNVAEAIRNPPFGKENGLGKIHCQGRFPELRAFSRLRRGRVAGGGSRRSAA